MAGLTSAATGVVGEIRSATGLLTRLPVGAVRDGRAGAAAFPLVGLVIGALAAVPLVVAGPAEPTVAAVLAIAVAAVVTGGLHLDGLADTADALMAPDPERAEVARRDPRVGSGAVVALVLTLAVEVAAVSSLVAGGDVRGAAGALVVAFVVSRLVPVVATRQPSRGRPGDHEDGFGAWFAGRVTWADTATALVLAATIVASIAVLCDVPALGPIGAVGGTVGVALAWWIVAARGRSDGDGMGASVELTLAATLVVSAIVLPG